MAVPIVLPPFSSRQSNSVEPFLGSMLSLGNDHLFYHSLGVAPDVFHSNLLDAANRFMNAFPVTVETFHLLVNHTMSIQIAVWVEPPKMTSSNDAKCRDAHVDRQMERTCFVTNVEATRFKNRSQFPETSLAGQIRTGRPHGRCHGCSDVYICRRPQNDDFYPILVDDSVGDFRIADYWPFSPFPRCAGKDCRDQVPGWIKPSFLEELLRSRPVGFRKPKLRLKISRLDRCARDLCCKVSVSLYLRHVRFVRFYQPRVIGIVLLPFMRTYVAQIAVDANLLRRARTIGYLVTLQRS